MSDARREKNPAPIAARARAVKEALEEKGLVPDGFIDSTEAAFSEQFHWRNGAKVVAKAWTDPDYRERLLKDGTAACAELGFEGPEGEYIVVLEDQPDLHNVIVCTQCSCTAWPVLGLPPDWYKSKNYRARVVIEPREVLKEFGTEIPDDMAVRVHDSLANLRYLVLPRRPAGTEGWSEEQLAEIVTRDTLVGVVNPKVPADA